MKPEFELLVRCCGIARNLPVFGASTQTILPDGFDENLFADMAIQHKTAATTLAGLKKMNIALGAVATGRLKAIAVQNRLVRGLILEDACAIIEAARKHGIPALVLKGPASSKELYGDAFAREYNDLDILVNLPAVVPMIPIMAGLGYVAEEYHSMKNADLEDSKLLQRGHHITFWKNGSPFRVELHDRIGWERETFKRDDIDAVFDRAVTLEESGNVFISPDLPDHAMLILAHGTKHAWCLLHWLLDAAALIAHGDVSLHRAIAARVRLLDMQDQLKLACDLVQKLYPIGLPPAIEAALINEPTLDFPVQFAMDQVQSGGRYMEVSRKARALLTRFSLPFIRKRRDKAAFLLSPFKIQQIDLEAVPLPRRLLFLHLLLRPYFVLSRRWKKHLEKRAALHA